MVESKTQLACPASLDIERVRRDFPILRTRVGNAPLVYLDNAATTQKPQVVIEALERFYAEQNANIHRGIHYLSERASDAYENARRRIADFINAPREREVIFVRGATEGINLVAQSFGRKFVHQGDEILISTLEHHANIVPWQMMAEERGAGIRVIPMDDRGVLDFEAFENLLSERTRIIGLTYISNALGTVNPVVDMIAAAHARDIPVLIDGAQAASHVAVDVEELDCDFFVFSGHKVFGPTGIGILYGKEKWLNEMPPYQGGGDMIRSVSFTKTLYREIPEKFEAGTPHIGGVIALAEAIDYFDGLGRGAVEAYEACLVSYALNRLGEIDGLRVVGTAPQRASVVSFWINDVHPHDIGTFLDNDGIAIRAGHHCAQPLMNRLGLPGTARASFSIYNTREEVDQLELSLRKIIRFFNR